MLFDLNCDITVHLPSKNRSNSCHANPLYHEYISCLDIYFDFGLLGYSIFECELTCILCYSYTGTA